MQKKYLVITAAAAVAACSGLIAQGVPTPQSVYVRQLPALTQAVQTILEKPNAAPPDIAGVRAGRDLLGRAKPNHRVYDRVYRTGSVCGLSWPVLLAGRQPGRLSEHQPAPSQGKGRILLAGRRG